MSAAFKDLHQPALDGAPPARAGRILVWVGNNRHAESLVRHASRLANAEGVPWSVICVETPTSARQSDEERSHALHALALAEQLGARTEALTAESVVSAVAERVRREGATMVILGAHAADGWLAGEQRHWLGGLADALSARLPDVTVNVINYPAPQTQDTRRPRTAPMRMPWSRPDWLMALAVVVLCTVVSETFHIEPASAASVYLAGVVYVALRLGQSAAVLTVLASILMFDLLFVEPRWSLTPIDSKYYFTFVMMLAVGLLISRLAAHARLQAFVAEGRARRAQALNEVASRLVMANSDEAIGAALAQAVQSTFGVASVLMLPDAGGRLRQSVGAGAVEGLDLDIAQRLLDAGHAPAGGAEGHDGARFLLLLGAGGPLGVFGIRPMPARFGTPEDRQLLDALANLAALALERVRLQHRSAAAAVEVETERLRSTLLSGISHDFRTPLTTIIGAATSLREQDLDTAHRQMLLDHVLGEARRMHALMSDLLDLTRMEEGAAQPNLEWCPADELVEAARAALGDQLANHRLRVDARGDALVWCDARLVEQALVNLLGNAVRYVPAGGTIDVRVEVEAGQCRLVVADDGPGIPPGRERDVFRKFFRGRNEPADGGTGLGLAICAAVARLHGGRIEARNEGGARFTVTLPQPEPPRLVEAA